MPRRLLLIAVAVLIGAASLIFMHFSGSSPKPLATGPASQNVLVAAVDLPAGTFVRADQLRWLAWPANAVAPNWVVKPAGKLNMFDGAVTRAGIAMNEPITKERVVMPHDRGFIAAVLSPGDRAVTVSVSPISSDAGFILPGAHVDLILTGSAAGTEGRPEHMAETVLSNLRVLAMDQRVDDVSRNAVMAKTATLEVTPKQAEIIALAGSVGKLSLSLRSLLDDRAPPAKLSQTWEKETLPPAPEPAPVAGQPASGGTMQVVRGVSETSVPFNAKAAGKAPKK